MKKKKAYYAHLKCPSPNPTQASDEEGRCEIGDGLNFGGLRSRGVGGHIASFPSFLFVFLSLFSLSVGQKGERKPSCYDPLHLSSKQVLL